MHFAGDGHQKAITQTTDYFKCNSSYHLIALYKSDHHRLWILLWEVKPSKLTHQVCCLKKWHFAAITQMKDYRPSNFLQTWPILTPHTKEDSECPRQNWGKKSQQEHYQLQYFRKLGKAADFQAKCTSGPKKVVLAVLPTGTNSVNFLSDMFPRTPF